MKTSSRRRPATLVSSLVDYVSCELLCIRGSSTCVTILCWFSVSPVFSFVFPSFPFVFFVLFAGFTPIVKDLPLGFLPYITLYLEPR